MTSFFEWVDRDHPKTCSGWFARDSTTGDHICDCGIADAVRLDPEQDEPEPGDGEDDGSTQPVETVLVFSNSPSVTVTAP